MGASPIRGQQACVGCPLGAAKGWGLDRQRLAGATHARGGETAPLFSDAPCDD
ncbi:MAG: hypothetical protein U0350_15530 [Caldilineaceae bacterium]